MKDNHKHKAATDLAKLHTHTQPHTHTHDIMLFEGQVLTELQKTFGP